MEDLKEKKRVQMSLMIDPDLRRLVRRLAADSDTSQADVVNDALRQVFHPDFRAHLTTLQSVIRTLTPNVTENR